MLGFLDLGISAVNGAVDFFGNLFGGTPEDKSAIGFESYIQQSGARNQSYPTKSWIISQGRMAGWPADDLAAINSTYNQSSGTGNKGDWKFAITDMSPVTITWFKGSNERFTRATNAVFGEPSNEKNKQAQQSAFTGEVKTGSAPMNPVVKWVLIGVGVFVAIVGTLVLIFKRKR